MTSYSNLNDINSDQSKEFFKHATNLYINLCRQISELENLNKADTSLKIGLTWVDADDVENLLTNVNDSSNIDLISKVCEEIFTLVDHNIGNDTGKIEELINTAIKKVINDEEQKMQNMDHFTQVCQQQYQHRNPDFIRQNTQITTGNQANERQQGLYTANKWMNSRADQLDEIPQENQAKLPASKGHSNFSSAVIGHAKGNVLQANR